MAIIDKINEEIKNAMKNKDQQRLNVIRMLKAKILHVNARGDVSDEEAGKLFKNYAKGLKETIDISRENGKEDAAKEAEAELEIVSEYLPEEMSEDAVKEIVQAVISDLGVNDKSGFGQVMKETMTRSKGQADGALVKDIVNSKLS